VKCPFFL